MSGNSVLNKNYPSEAPRDRLVWPYFDEEAVELVKQVLLSGRVNQWTGSEVRLFEEEYAAFVGSKHAIAVANGTVSLEIALKVLGVQPGDEVIVPSRTFWGTASAVMMVGAVPVFADVDLDTGNISAETIADCLTPKTKVIIPVHVGGIPCEMDPIMELADKHNIFVIEDCAQSHGALYKNRMTGTIGHIGSFSFCQDKIMTTGGEGGMITTDDHDLWRKMWSFKDHGKNLDKTLLATHSTNNTGFKYVHDYPGTNVRMTEMQAVLGRWALKRLPSWLKKRSENAKKLDNYFKDIPYVLPFKYPDWMQPAFYRCYVHVVQDKLPQGWDRDRVIAELNQQGLPAVIGTCCEIYKEAAVGGVVKSLPSASALSKHSFCFKVDDGLG